MTFASAFTSNIKLLAASTLLLGALTTAGHAYTPDQEQLCTGDAMRLCSSDIPDVDRVTACMIRQREQLSDGCKTVFHAPAPLSYQSTTARTAKPMNLSPVKFKRPTI